MQQSYYHNSKIFRRLRWNLDWLQSQQRWRDDSIDHKKIDYHYSYI